MYIIVIILSYLMLLSAANNNAVVLLNRNYSNDLVFRIPQIFTLFSKKAVHNEMNMVGKLMNSQTWLTHHYKRIKTQKY